MCDGGGAGRDATPLGATFNPGGGMRYSLPFGPAACSSTTNVLRSAQRERPGAGGAALLRGNPERQNAYPQRAPESGARLGAARCLHGRLRSAADGRTKGGGRLWSSGAA